MRIELMSKRYRFFIFITSFLCIIVFILNTNTQIIFRIYLKCFFCNVKTTRIKENIKWQNHTKIVLLFFIETISITRYMIFLYYTHNNDKKINIIKNSSIDE